jgi:hypothetical protein
MLVVADIGTWAADHLIAPILTGVFVGIALRWAVLPGEVANHDARAEEMNADLIRFVRDRTRQLDGEIIHAANLAMQGIIEDVAQAPVPRELEGTKPGSLVDSGAFLGRVGRLMLRALHEYRDEASRKVREYKGMARSEGWTHRAFRRATRRREPSALVLPDDGRKALDTWRTRDVRMADGGVRTAAPKEDPTKAADASDIAPLETEAGLTWESVDHFG